MWSIAIVDADERPDRSDQRSIIDDLIAMVHSRLYRPGSRFHVRIVRDAPSAVHTLDEFVKLEHTPVLRSRVFNSSVAKEDRTR